MPNDSPEIVAAVLSQCDGWSIIAEAPIPSDALSVFAEHAGYKVAGVAVAVPPSRRGGGDGVFAIPLGPDAMLTGVVDSEGHDEAGAAFMLAEIRASVRLMIDEPGDILVALNAAMLARGLRGSALIARVATDGIRMAGAASPYPTIFDACGGVETAPVCGPILGRIELGERETLALVSDGVTECGICCHGEMYGVDRMARCIDPDMSLAANLLRCTEDVLSWARNRHDDFSILLLRAEADANSATMPVKRPLLRPEPGVPVSALTLCIAC
jgi:hypothetical protein